MSYEQLKSLLEGLDVPNPDFWMLQPPGVLRELGKAISDQAKIVTQPDDIELKAAIIREQLKNDNTRT